MKGKLSLELIPKVFALRSPLNKKVSYRGEAPLIIFIKFFSLESIALNFLIM
jgi:hypothetical protein